MIDKEYNKILKQYHKLSDRHILVVETDNVVVGLLGNESSDSNRFTLVTPKSENDVRLQATLDNQNPTGLPVGAVRINSFQINNNYLIKGDF